MKIRYGGLLNFGFFLAIFIFLFGILTQGSAYSGDSPFNLLKKASSIVESVKNITEGKSNTDATPKNNTQKASASSSSAPASAINVLLKNNSSSTISVGLIDQYGGNYTANIDGGMSQNHTLKLNSKITVNNTSVHTVSSGDEGREIVISGK